ncbi:MAG: ribosome-binding factor A [Labilithrix sp.]|nr:ribosome-binding factor A [Labilithrix sp.]MBX3225016.1 ribosome-binding factor A [Labilithrix sp.]
MRNVKDGPGAAGAHRHQRVEASILEELRSVLRDDVTDPELEGVRLTAIVLSPDSKVARVHYAVPRARPRTAVDRAFTRAAGFLRGRLAEGVELKRTPDLRFVYEAEIDPASSDEG